ncbi:transmembrane protein [Mycobacterium tuberculosis]|nr:transmembrane protein [Mycobacterium tuberculosis]
MPCSADHEGVGGVADQSGSGGQPVTLSVVYHPQPLVLTLLLATIAGVLSVVGTARLRRARAGLNAHPDGLNQRPPGGWCH